MKNENLIYLIAFLLSLSLILLLEAGTLRLLAEDIKPVERKEVEIELLLSASNNPAEEITQAGNNEDIKESENKQEENDSKEKEIKSEEVDKSSSVKNEEKELEKNDQFVEEEEKGEEKEEEKEVYEAAEEEIKTEKIPQENNLNTEEIAEKVEETKKEVQETKKEAENKEKPDKIEPEVQEDIPSENKVVEEKQDKMPAWLDNSKTKTEKDNSKEIEEETKEEEKEDKFDLESFLAELENEDSAVQENKVNINNKSKSDHNLRENESETEGESRENSAKNRQENKADTAAEAVQNNEEQEVYDLREGRNDIKKPGLKNYSRPSYPSNLRKRNIEGKVIISLRIDKEGKAHDLKINQSSGYDSFDQAALNAVSSWEFKAAEKDGRKVEVIVNLPVRFKLN